MKLIKLISINIALVGMLNAAVIQDEINLSGKQRMYTQIILKDYALTGLNKENREKEKCKKIEAELNTTIDLFNNALIELSKDNNDPEKEELFEIIKIKWKTIKDIIKKEKRKENGIKLKNKVDNILFLSDNLVSLYDKEKDIVNVSGKQRMLLQKIAANYILSVWDKGNENTKKDMINAITEFQNNLNILFKNKNNSDKIKLLLSEVRRDFNFMNFMTNKFTKTKTVLMYDLSNNLVKKMNKITELYIELEKN